jgi:hypothetical protein
MFSKKSYEIDDSLPPACMSGSDALLRGFGKERSESNKESMRLLTELLMDLTASIISVSEEYTSTMAAFDEVQVILKK